MIKEIRYEGNKVFIATNQGRIVKEFDSEIGQVLEVDQKCLVLFRLKGEKTPDRNIVCLNLLGELLWQVQDPDEWRTGKAFQARDLFYAVWLRDDMVWASGRSSDYRIDLANGRILEEVYTK